MRKAKWVLSLLAAVLVIGVTVVLVAFSDPVGAAMFADGRLAWARGSCVFVDSDRRLWVSQLRGLDADAELDWYARWGSLDTATRDELSSVLKQWAAEPATQAEVERAKADWAKDRPGNCNAFEAYSDAVVRGDLAFVATEHVCGFDCAGGGIVAMRRRWFGWVPVAHLHTWIT